MMISKTGLSREEVLKLPIGEELILKAWCDNDPDEGLLKLVAKVVLVTQGGKDGCLVRIEKIIEAGSLSSEWKPGNEFNALYSELYLETE